MFSCFGSNDDEESSCFRRKIEATEMINMDRRSEQGQRISVPTSPGVLEPPRPAVSRPSRPLREGSPTAEQRSSFLNGGAAASPGEDFTQKPTSSYWPPGQSRLTATQKSMRDLHQQYKRGSESRSATPTPTAFTGTASMTPASSFSEIFPLTALQSKWSLQSRDDR